MNGQKYKIIAIFLVALIGAGLYSGVYYKDKINDFFYNINIEISQIEKISLNELIGKIEQDISTPPPLAVPPSDKTSAGILTAEGVIKWTNIQRSENGLAALTVNQKLNAAALAKAQDMFKNQYFAHESPSGVGPGELAASVNYDFLSVGENLILGNFSSDQEMVLEWMNSPGHRANILNSKYKEIGVAVLQGTYEGKKVWIGVQEFGLAASFCPTPDAKLKTAIDSYQSQIDEIEKSIQAKEVELQTVGRSDRQASKILISQYNKLINQYNNLVTLAKPLIAQYNSQVNQYNQCLSSIKN